MINSLLKLDPEFVSENEKILIGQYPNTYTFTKSMAERAIKIKRGNLRVTIVRPSIVIAAYQEPVIGWTDSIAAGGIIIMTMINGYTKNLKFPRDIIIDFTPVDYVTNITLASTAYSALEETPALNIVHATSSHVNPIQMGYMVDICNDFSRKFPSIAGFRPPGVINVPKKSVYKAHVFVKETLPAKLLHCYGSLPYIGSKEVRRKASQLKKLTTKMEQLQDTFLYFASNTWIFQSEFLEKLI